MTDIIPKSWNQKTKPHLLCPGCGHGIALKHLGYVIDDLKIINNLTIGIDIGCSLLAWNFFNTDIIQTHHGRTTSVMVGYKMAEPKKIALAYMGDGAAYAIGLQSIMHAAHRNNPITCIVVNNQNYAMTGGQMSPTTPVGRITTTSPKGKDIVFGQGMMGPEMVASAANTKSYVARATISNPILLQNILNKAIINQVDNNSFSFVEILSICPTNWKTDAKKSFENLKEMENLFKLGEISKEEK